MIIHPARPDLALWEVADLDSAPPSVTATFAWARSYLSRPHPELGRPGPVCPFVPSALRSQLVYVAVQPGVPGDAEAVAGAVLGYRDWFAELEPSTGPQAELKTILILFPDLPAAAMPELIDRTQSALKPAFVPNGLMIGEFHPTPPEQPGLWNPDFRPLRSPVPLLAIRQMVPSDLPFLADDREYLTAYLRQFGDQVPARCRPQLEGALARFGLTDPAARAAG